MDDNERYTLNHIRPKEEDGWVYADMSPSNILFESM